MNFVHGDSAKELENFKIIYSVYAPSLLGVISRIVKDDALAETVLEETFSTIWNELPSFNEDHHRLFTWVSMIARATALKERENQSRQQIPHQETETSMPRIFELICKDGFNTSQVAEELKLPISTVCKELRVHISKMR